MLHSSLNAMCHITPAACDTCIGLQGIISGAAIRTYLLERSRVVAVNNPERNYHIFYQVQQRRA